MIKMKNPLMGKSRLEAFSDGVFAIAITLLILEVKIPKQEDIHALGGLYKYLMHIWPSYIAYFVTFFMIGIYWSNHHHLFAHIIKKTDHYFNLINIWFLLGIAFMPFSTAVFSDYILDPESRNAAVTIYCIGLFLTQPPLILFIIYGKKRKGIFDPNLDPEFLNKQFVKMIIATTITMFSIAMSFYYPMISLTITGATWLMYFLPPDVPVFNTMNNKD